MVARGLAGEPSIELVKDGKVQRISVERLSGEPGFRRLIPVSGKILCATVETDADPMGAIREAVWELFKEMLTDLAGEKGNEIDKYRWSARLLGWMKLPPRVRTSTGDRVTGTKVLSIWRDEGVLWLSDGRGDIDGLFPDGAPEIFLSEQGNEGLLAVLRARAKSNPIRELGSVSVPDSSSGQREAPGAPEAVAAPEDAAVPEAAPDPEPEGELVDTWLDTLVHHVVSWGRPAPKGAPPSSDLAEALLTQLDTLGLAGSPASAVAYSRRGKAVRYQSEHKRVVLNREHAAVRALGRKVDDRIAVALMAAAAISELNRSLEGVNDAEEKRALLQLLKSL